MLYQCLSNMNTVVTQPPTTQLASEICEYVDLMLMTRCKTIIITLKPQSVWTHPQKTSLTDWYDPSCDNDCCV